MSRSRMGKHWAPFTKSCTPGIQPLAVVTTAETGRREYQEMVKKAQVLVDGALYQDAAFMRCDLNHTATCC